VLGCGVGVAESLRCAITSSWLFGWLLAAKLVGYNLMTIKQKR